MFQDKDRPEADSDSLDTFPEGAIELSFTRPICDG